MCLHDNDFIKRLATRLIESKSCYVTLLKKPGKLSFKDKLNEEIIKQLSESKEKQNG